MQMNELPSGRFPAGFVVPPAAQGEPKRRFLPDVEIAKCQTFRQACALAWKHRVLPGMTLQMLAALADLQHQHVSDYFHPERSKDGLFWAPRASFVRGIVSYQLGYFDPLTRLPSFDPWVDLPIR